MKQKKLLALLLAVCMLLTLLPAIAAADETEVTDTLTKTETGMSGTTYGNWTYMSQTSGATYAGQSAADKGTIQLRSKNSNSGIVTTVSGGNVKKITVDWNDSTAAGRTLDVYGKNTAYTNPTDLYSDSTFGTKLGSIIFGSSTELTIEGEYAYVGVRSNNGALYMDSISFTWGAGGDQPQPETYTVYLDPGEAEGEPVTIENVESPYHLPACPFTAPEGQEFAGWTVVGDEESYAEGTSYTLTEDTTFYATWKDLPVVSYTDMKLKRVPGNGDTVVIYSPKASKVMTGESYLYTDKNKYELKVTDAVLTDDILAVPDAALRLTVSVDADGKYTFATADGRYLEADGTNVQLVSEQNANTLFRLVPTVDGGTDSYYIVCDSATYNNIAQYLEYYGGCISVYGLQQNNNEVYVFQFFSEDGEGPTPEVLYTVTLNPGDAEGDAVIVEDAKSPYTLPECPFEVPTGFVFDGWTAEDGTVYAAGDEVTLTANATFTAAWKALDAKTYRLVTSADELIDGGTYLIASELFADELYIVSKQNNNNRAQYKVTGVEGSTVTLDRTWIATNANDALVFEFKLEQQDNGWAFYDAVKGGYIYAASSGSNYLRTETELDDNGIFAIAFEGTDGATVPVAQGSNTRKYMHYNASSGLFSCYAETTSVTNAVYLYKLTEDEPAALEDGFYLIGPDWTVGAIDAAEKFGANVEVGGEYLLPATLAVGDQIKVVKVENNAITAWYPDGLDNQYTVDAAHAGDVTVYFRETYNNDWAEFGGYFYIAADHAINCVSGEHGFVSTAASRASVDTTVTIYIEFEEGYELDTLTVLCGETEIQTTKVNDEQYTFVMPAGDVTVTATFKEIAAEPKVPAFVSQTLVLDGKIGVGFKMDLPEIDGVDYADSYMTFTVEHDTCTERVDYSAARGSGTARTFDCYVNAVMMAEPITAVFHYTQDGSEKTIEKTYAIVEYFEMYDQYKDSFDATTQALIEALADYGHYAQAMLAAQKGWTLGTTYVEMNKFYTESYDIDAIAAAVADKGLTCENNGADFSKMTFATVLDSATELRVLFTVTKNYNGTFTATVDGEDFEVTMLGARKAVQIMNIPAHLLSKTHEIVITTDNGTATINVSVLSYVKVLLAANDASMQNAAAALYNYSAAADAYKQAH